MTGTTTYEKKTNLNSYLTPSQKNQCEIEQRPKYKTLHCKAYIFHWGGQKCP